MLRKLSVFAASLAMSGALLSAPTYATADEVVGGPLVQENVLGSFLVFTKFDIRGESSTQLRIVNNGYGFGSNNELKVKLNFVCPGVKFVNDFCAALDTTIYFTPHQTRIIDVADLNPPCNQGYVVAYALNDYGRPVSYNYLNGSYHILEGRRHEAENAIAIQSTQSKGSVLGDQGKLRFGTGDYSAMPSTLYTDFRAVGTGEGASGSRLTLLTLDVLAGMQNPAAVVFINFWNAAEVAYSTSHEFICWSEVQLDDIDYNFLEENLGTTYGSMKLWGFPNCPIPGGCPPMIAYDATILGHLTEYGDGTLGGRTLAHDSTPKYTAYQPR